MLRLVLWQGSVAPQVPCLMDKETTAATLLGAQSLTPVTQGTGWLQVVLVEHVSQMVSGQGVIQHVLVSAHYCALPLQQHTNAIILHNYTWSLQTLGYCGSPGTVPVNGRRIITGYTEGHTVTYTCNTGYRLSGVRTRTCQSNGLWSGNQPTCPSKCLDCVYVPSPYWPQCSLSRKQ